MNQREAKQTAHRIVANLIQNYFDVGQPHTDGMDGITTEEDAEKLYDGLVEIRDYHDRFGYDHRRPSHQSEKA